MTINSFPLFTALCVCTIGSFVSGATLNRNSRNEEPEQDEGEVWVQSPIAINWNNSTIVTDAQPLKLRYYAENDGRAFIKNTGHTAQIIFQDLKVKPFVSGGLLAKDEKYIFEQIHFHWGSNDKIGSEHIIDGKSYSMEAHLVHYNAKYGNFKTAVIKKDGLVVVAIFIEATGIKGNKKFAKITNHLQNIEQSYSKDYLEPDCLSWIPFEEINTNYFTYHGSLTTTPYNEVVTWIIYNKPVYVSKQQVAGFRNLRRDDENLIKENFRPIQTPDQTPTVFFVGNP